MTIVGWIGLGKLGAPCAAALAKHGGHTVIGYDVRGIDSATYDWSGQPPVELTNSIEYVVRGTDGVVFVAVQTPHSAEYGGETPLGATLRDFEYQYLVNATRDVCDVALRLTKHVTMVVVSTVLPGTFDRFIRPMLNEYVTPVYHPFFIAMGTVVDDFLFPEMTLFGVERPGDERPVRDVYTTIPDQRTIPAPVVSIPSAELTKVAYNTFISTKITFANTIAELADHTGADVDEVTDALGLANQRIISTRYMRAGMGDGGACHPRDNIALAALAERYGVRANLFRTLITLRERHSEWLAEQTRHWTELTGLPIVILGRAYKPNVAMEAGSPALLLIHQLQRLGVDVKSIDPVMRPGDAETLRSRLLYAHVYVVATLHSNFVNLDFPSGSIVIDPFGAITPQPRITLVTPGRRAIRRGLVGPRKLSSNE